MSALHEYVKRLALYAARIETGIQKLESLKPESGSGVRAQVMADTAELHEITNRMYNLLYGGSKPVLPDQVDPLTLRFRKYEHDKHERDQQRTSQASPAAMDETQPKGETSGSDVGTGSGSSDST